MDAYHRQTFHTWESVRSGRGMDWSLQPEVFKRYPQEWATVPLDALPQLRDFLHHSCGLTAKKVYPGGSYALRANPSAGALYPCELYLQARGLANLSDGIYHFEPFSGELRLLHPLSSQEGIEGYWHRVGMVKGLVLLISTIYFRSSWKYGHRALRYCLLDSGHLLGAVEAATCVQERSFSAVTCFNRHQLQVDFGFKNRELPMIMVAYGEETVEQVVCPDMGLPFVDGSGSFVRDPVIESAFEKICQISGCRPGEATGMPYSAKRDDLTGAILHRRSIRSFTGQPITCTEYEAVLHTVTSGLSIDCDEPLQLFVVVNRVEGMDPGLYTDGRCLRSGDFSAMAGYLCLEQDLGSESAATVFLVGRCPNYLPLMLKAGLVGQRIYLAATLLGLGCSGIGAFYDQEINDFLETDDLVLYALAFGR